MNDVQCVATFSFNAYLLIAVESDPTQHTVTEIQYPYSVKLKTFENDCQTALSRSC